MLCARCQQRDAIGPPPDAKARLEERLGTPWPFPTDLCAQCLGEVLGQDPKLRANAHAFRKAMNAKLVADVKGAVRKGIEKALDLADRIAAKLS